MNESMKPILARLIAARKAAGLTQQEAAEAIGLTRASSLSDLETGRAEIKLRQVLALCGLYDVSPAWIVAGEPQLVECLFCGAMTSAYGGTCQYG